MKKILFIISFLVLPFFTFAEAENVGIIKGIWFSDSQFFDGDTIRIYTAVQNNSGSDASGDIEFFDNGKSIGSKSFSALNNRIIESWMDTTAISGEHEFSVRITQLKKGGIAVIAQEIFSERLSIVKIDTDGDNIPDDIDTDDDGDGVSDTDEIAAGSDPLDKESIPVKKKELKNTNAVINVIKNIFNRDSSENSDNNPSPLKNEKIPLVKMDDLLEQSPNIAKKFAEQNDIIKSLVLQVSRLQNGGKNIIEHEQIRLDGNKKNEKTVRIKNTKNTDKTKIEKQNKQGKSFSGILLSIYKVILGIFSWLFSVWWFVVLLLFFGIYIILKLLFRIFGRSRN